MIIISLLERFAASFPPLSYYTALYAGHLWERDTGHSKTFLHTSNKSRTNGTKKKETISIWKTVGAEGCNIYLT